MAVQQYSPASCSVALRIMKRTPVNASPDLIYSTRTGPPKPSENNQYYRTIKLFNKFHNRNIIKLKAALSKEEEQPVTSASIIVALDYSLGDPFGPFMLAEHLSSYFATLRMDHSLKI